MTRVTPSALLDGEGDRWSVVDEDVEADELTIEREGTTLSVTRLDIATGDWRVAPSPGGQR